MKDAFGADTAGPYGTPSRACAFVPDTTAPTSMLGTERRRGAPRSEAVLSSSRVYIPGAKQYRSLCPTSAFTACACPRPPGREPGSIPAWYPNHVWSVDLSRGSRLNT